MRRKYGADEKGAAKFPGLFAVTANQRHTAKRGGLPSQDANCVAGGNERDGKSSLCRLRIPAFRLLFSVSCSARPYYFVPSISVQPEAALLKAARVMSCPPDGPRRRTDPVQ